MPVLLHSHSPWQDCSWGKCIALNRLSKMMGTEDPPSFSSKLLTYETIPFLLEQRKYTQYISPCLQTRDVHSVQNFVPSSGHRDRFWMKWSGLKFLLSCTRESRKGYAAPGVGLWSGIATTIFGISKTTWKLLHQNLDIFSVWLVGLVWCFVWFFFLFLFVLKWLNCRW